MRTATDATITFVSAQWRLLEVESLTPRSLPLVCTFGKDQVLIIGGIIGSRLSDGIIWNTTTKATDHIMQGGGLKFNSFNSG